MKLFFDTEFTGLHKDTSIISIGIIAENNQCFYAKFTDYDTSQVNDWIQQNVIDNIELSDTLKDMYDIIEVSGSKEEVRKSLLDWLSALNSDYYELVSDVCYYDMVLFTDIFGTSFDLPENICPLCYDISYDIYEYVTADMREAFDISREELLSTLHSATNYEISDILEIGDNSKHNALYDAIIIKLIYENI